MTTEPTVREQILALGLERADAFLNIKGYTVMFQLSFCLDALRSTLSNLRIIDGSDKKQTMEIGELKYGIERKMNELNDMTFEANNEVMEKLKSKLQELKITIENINPNLQTKIALPSEQHRSTRSPRKH